MDFKFSYRKLLTLSALIFFSAIVFAQNTVVSGKITDATDRKPLPRVAVSFVGTTNGAISNDKGEYIVGTNQSVTQIKVSFLGYKDAFVPIKTGISQVINIRLAPVASQLKEVIVRSGKKPRYRNKDNPAVDLIRKVIENKEKNRPASYDYVEYKEYDKTTFSLVNVPNSVGDKPVFKHYKFMFDNRDSTSVPGKSLLPFFLDEDLSQYYYRKTPEKEKTAILGQKTVNFGGSVD
ncbi:MAG TPA: carboxypeptidase-like regulatory domain-containing protein, partial [Mucilaginibacter sp.]|nr:carboxypeptidase-like regulatory domain-containing protein [Mucilaginibacter sp.]